LGSGPSAKPTGSSPLAEPSGGIDGTSGGSGNSDDDGASEGSSSPEGAGSQSTGVIQILAPLGVSVSLAFMLPSFPQLSASASLSPLVGASTSHSKSDL
jgi:hypothetical protein